MMLQVNDEYLWNYNCGVDVGVVVVVVVDVVNVVKVAR